MKNVCATPCLQSFLSRLAFVNYFNEEIMRRDILNLNATPSHQAHQYAGLIGILHFMTPVHISYSSLSSKRISSLFGFFDSPPPRPLFSHSLDLS